MKERRKYSKKGSARSEDPLQDESHSKVNEESRVMNKRIMNLMREIIKLYDFAAELQMLTDDLGMMELQFPIAEA